MLRFFRHIRQRLLTDNKFSKYLLYAVGEILLVVIGILIALQVNNQNEERIERSFERKMLAELHASIQNNIEYLEMAINGNDDARKSCQLILDHFEAGLPYHDTLDDHFSKSLFWFHPSLDNNAYESLKSYGLHLISNDSIRLALGDIYEWSFVDRYSNRQEEYFFGTVAPLLVNWFESYDFYGPMKPLNYDELSSSSAYRHILKTMISNRNGQIELHEKSKNTRLQLARMINEELSKIK